MRDAKTWIKEELGFEMPEGQVSGDWFVKHGLPMIVRCTCCQSTMALPSAMIDDEGHMYCPSCAC